MRRPLILLLILLVIFALFFYFSLGTKLEFVGREVLPPPPSTSYLDSVIQKSYPNYVYLEGTGYVQSDRRAVIFPSGISDSTHSKEISAMEKKLESYWKWEIFLGNKNFEEINLASRKSNQGNTVRDKKKQPDDARKNIFSRFLDVFKVADAVKVEADKTQYCECDPNFILLMGPDLHLVKATLNPDTPIIATGNLSDSPNVDSLQSKFNSQRSNNRQVGYDKQQTFTIGIIDSGINFAAMPGKSPDSTIDYNFLNHSANVSDVSLGIHGTEIAKIVETKMNSVNMKYVGLKTFDEKSVGNLYNNLCAVIYSIKHRIRVVNASWGVASNETAFEAVMTQAKKANLTVVCSAGNQKVDIDKSPWYPACYADHPVFGNNIVSVTSKYNTVVCQNTSSSETKIDVSVESDKNCKHGELIGTSFAAPYVTAAVVKYMVFSPTFTKSAFMSSLAPGSEIKKFKK